jgi:hypothetical protein
MRTLATAISLLLPTNHPAQAEPPATLAVAVDTSNLTPKLATELPNKIGLHVLNRLEKALSNAYRTRIHLSPVSDADAVAAIMACETSPCLQNIAQGGVADLVVGLASSAVACKRASE